MVSQKGKALSGKHFQMIVRNKKAIMLIFLVDLCSIFVKLCALYEIGERITNVNATVRDMKKKKQGNRLPILLFVTKNQTLTLMLL